MAEKKFWARFLETKTFGLVIGLAVFGLMMYVSFGTVIIQGFEQKVLDFNFRFKNAVTGRIIQQGVSSTVLNPRISQDILIIAIDDRSLNRFGKWPFPRYRHADLIDAFSHIKNQNEREKSLFLDIFFIEPDKEAENDVRLVSSIKNSGRVFLESVMEVEENTPGTEEDFFSRQDILAERLGVLTNIQGDWTKVTNFNGVLSPLKPYSRAAYGYGNPSFVSDSDQVYRKQPLVGKLARLVDEIPLEGLKESEPVDRAGFERLAWVDKDNVMHDVPYPLTPAVISELTREMQKNAPQRADDTDGDGTPDVYSYVVRKYRDSIVPAIPLALALDYFNKKFSDVEIVLGKHIRIQSPQTFNAETQEWEPYKRMTVPPEYDGDGNMISEGTYVGVPEILIPIDNNGMMLLNFMGNPSSANPDGYQTFPIRSYAGYAGTPPSQDPAKWPSTKKVANNILMVGIFAQGLAQDQKPTPFGLMYGVEIHATALNTILMGNFLVHAEAWVTILILFGVIMITALVVSRLSTIWSLVATAIAILVYFFAVLIIFDLYNYVLTLSAPVVGCFFCFLAVVAYRTVTEERDKRKIKDMFSRYVSPSVVAEILANPPELGGVDKQLTVFFSDIRGFTTLSESLSPQELVNHLNAYLTAMTDILLDYQGTLDKYIGDSIMGFWGAPLPQPDHALLACKCALKQMEVLAQLNEIWPTEKRIAIGIGLNSGIMTVGNMGSLGRMNYTLTGDNVNLGARLEGTNKTYATNIIMSEFTYELVKEKVVARELDNLRVKGKNKPVIIYELLDVIEGLIPPKPLVLKGMNR
jgi:adenylate cyclase